MRRVGYGIALYISATSVAHAYIDPGTGSLMIQGLIAALASVAVFWRHIVARLKTFFGRQSGPDETTESSDLKKQAVDD